MTPPSPSTTGADIPDHPGTAEWSVLGDGAVAWFSAGSHAQPGSLACDVLDLCTGAGAALPDVDVRDTGVRIRLRDGDGSVAARADLATAVSTAARRLGLEPQPEVLLEVGLVVDTGHEDDVSAFWQSALGYDRDGRHGLVDPLRRHLPLRFQPLDSPRPLRNRLHLDSVAAQPVASGTVDHLARAGAQVAHHGYYATLADGEGNEVDVLPLPTDADRWGEPDTDDWRLVFSAVAVYPTATPVATAQLVRVSAELADRASLPLLVDVRGTGTPRHHDDERPQAVVVLDTGKDRWEMDERYLTLCQQIQREARTLGLTATPERARFVQVGIDAADVPATRSFWQAVLGYEPDPRQDVTDLVDPRRLGPVLFFQPLDREDTARRAQRNRLHLEAVVAHDDAEARTSTALRAGGSVVRDRGPAGWTLADPEGNEVDVVVGSGREEGQV
ncbi:VOC family protein [Serinicoccus sediminis]|uniref:VOC family protein n=1 Tax=Serinicoccus sediminis TaxID=2306021 RepID=UPI00102265CE|nr:VOC family protein [Serinicoccus sediminis]